MKYTLSLLIIGAMLCASNAKAQQGDSLKQAHVKYISKQLSISESSAARVASIMEKYKDSAKNLVSDKSLSEAELRTRLDAIIADKNKKLSALLTKEQFEKFVPSSEWQKAN